jgi:nucleoside-diphosphate-sugar epimerase
MRTILITGVNGFIGSGLAAAAAARGFRVVGSTSSSAGLDVATPGVDRKVVVPLGGAWDPGILSGVDTIIHCAWNLRPGAARLDVAGTERLVEAAEAASVAHQVFISTNSAHPSAASEYGRSKLAVQRYMLERGHAVARPGLVIGPGGLFARLSSLLARSPLVPLVDGGRGLVPIIAIHDLTHALMAIVERRLAGLFNLFNPDYVTLRDVVLQIRATAGRRALPVPIPSKPLLGVIRLLETLGVTLPISVDNLQGLRANRDVREPSDLLAFVPYPLSLPEMVRAAAAAGLAPP